MIKETISPDINELARQVVDAAFQVQQNLAARLLESVYVINPMGKLHDMHTAQLLAYLKTYSKPFGFVNKLQHIKNKRWYQERDIMKTLCLRAFVVTKKGKIIC